MGQDDRQGAGEERGDRAVDRDPKAKSLPQVVEPRRRVEEEPDGLLTEQGMLEGIGRIVVGHAARGRPSSSLEGVDVLWT